MLYALRIKNIAVIDEVNIEFNDGFTVLTGETGAGKSIIIDSINMVLGQRTSRELIRHGEKKAVVEAGFFISDEVSSILENEYGIECDENNVILYRDINTEGKSICRINGMLTTAGNLKEISELLINIHGQHDNQQLLTQSRHIIFLDKFYGVKNELEEYKEIYENVRKIENRIKNITENDRDLAQRLDLLNFQINELKSADLKKDEEEFLKERRTFLGGAGKIAEAIQTAKSLLYNGDDYSKSVHDSLANTLNAISSVMQYDKKLEEFYNSLYTISEELDDLIYGIRDYSETLNFDESELDEVENRLDVIKSLERKYGATVEDVLLYYEKICEEVKNIKNSEEILQNLQSELKTEKEKLEKSAKILTEKRKKGAKKLEQQICSELSDLDMSKVRFSISIKEKEYSQNGCDNVEFLIATNAGDDLKPLTKIASGGEMSRIMLAIKTVLTDADAVNTLIFDEIDTGVSGRASQKIAEKICKISKSKQVICITHLPQIASMADNHFLIEKNTEKDVTRTKVTLLEGAFREEEIARIISGARVTDLTLENAREMLSLAKSIREDV